MKSSIALLYALLCATTINASIIPSESRDLSRRDADASAAFESAFDLSSLEKRKGGGGGGGGKGGGGGSSSSGSSSGGKGGSSSSGSSSSGSSSSGSTSSGASSGARGSTSNTGGRTAGGSGAPPSYGGYYGGGAAVPYTAGRSSARGLATVGLLGLGAVALIWPAIWLAGVYQYPWTHPYSFYNSSAGQNQTKPVLCLCQENSECGCDENDNSTYISSVIGDGSFANLNKSLAYVNDVNGTSTILINGTLPNGTTADGGTTSAAAGMKNLASNTGMSLIAMAVFWFVWM